MVCPARRGATSPSLRSKFEKYFLRKVRKGESEPFYEKLALRLMGIDKLKTLTGRPVE